MILYPSEFAKSSSRRARQRQLFDHTTKDNTIQEGAVIDICDVRPRAGSIFLLDYVDLQYKPMGLCDRVRLCHCRRALSWSGIGLDKLIIIIYISRSLARSYTREL
uniref:Uncharacterized protein n=1 Tax=Trichogramma kaykai TaxID=54128 RepID=A0ABD2XB38_9HYME